MADVRMAIRTQEGRPTMRSDNSASHVGRHISMESAARPSQPQSVALSDITVARSGLEELASRTIDILVASSVLLLAAPVALLIAVLVKLTSNGPVLFRQERVGKDGVPFTMLKFRTMKDGTHCEVLADEEQLQLYMSHDFKLPSTDPRITSVGRFLRKTSLDELPQLVNVLRGEMSVVGIRPIVAEQLGLRTPYDQSCYRMRRPGLTGLWQVEGRSGIAHEGRVQLDRRYVEEWSLLGDLWIMLRTPLAVLRMTRTH